MRRGGAGWGRLGNTAAAVLDVARLPGLLLLEEDHKCGDVAYAPKVMEKEKADVAYQQAAASSTHSATLSAAADDCFHVQLDKVPNGATATFGCRFIQSNGCVTAPPATRQPGRS